MPDAASQAPLDLEIDSQESRSESSDADGWSGGDVLMNTDMWFRPSTEPGRTFDGDSAMRHFSARGYHIQGHRLAAGHDEHGPYFRLLEVSSSTKTSRSLIWGRCFRKAGAAVIELDDDPPTGQPTNADAGSQKNVVDEIYDDIWTRPSLFRLALPTWLGGMDAPVNHAERTAFMALQRGWIDSDSLLGMLQFLPGRSAPRNTSGRGITTAGSEPKHFLAGAYVYGGQAGVLRNTLLYPWTCITLASLAKVQDRPFSFFSLSRDVLSRPHKDLNNDKTTMNVVVPLTRWKGGEVWVESAKGQSVLLPEARGARSIRSKRRSCSSKVALCMPRVHGRALGLFWSSTTFETVTFCPTVLIGCFEGLVFSCCHAMGRANK